MKISPVKNYNFVPFRANPSEDKEKENSFDKFVDNLQNEAKSVDYAARTVCNNSLLIKRMAKMLQKNVESYKAMLEIFLDDKNWQNSLEEGERVLFSTNNLKEASFLVVNEEGEVQRSSTIYPDGTCVFRLPTNNDDKKINCFRTSDDLKEICVTIGLDASNPDYVKSDKSYIIKNGELMEYQEGKIETPSSLEVNKVFNFEDEKLKTFYTNYRFNGISGSISTAYKFNDQEFMEEFSNKKAFTAYDKQSKNEFLFDGYRNYIYEDENTTVEFKDGKPVEIVKHLKGNDPIKSIKLDFKALSNSKNL